VQPSLRFVEQTVGLVRLARRDRRRQPAALPEVVVVDLRDRGAEAVLQLRLRRLDVLALSLERACLGKVELD